MGREPKQGGRAFDATRDDAPGPAIGRVTHEVPGEQCFEGRQRHRRVCHVPILCQIPSHVQHIRSVFGWFGSDSGAARGLKNVNFLTARWGSQSSDFVRFRPDSLKGVCPRFRPDLLRARSCESGRRRGARAVRDFPELPGFQGLQARVGVGWAAR